MDYAHLVDNAARKGMTRAQIAARLGITLDQVNAARTWLNSFKRPDAGLAPNLVD